MCRGNGQNSCYLIVSKIASESRCFGLLDFVGLLKQLACLSAPATISQDKIRCINIDISKAHVLN